jgi:hypothetical protein
LTAEKLFPIFILVMETTTQQPTISVNVKHEISLQRISDLLCSAFEGGSNYWYQIDKFIKPKNMSFRTDKDQIFRHLDYPLNEGGALIISDIEGDLNEPPWKRLNLDAIKKGLQIMAEKYPRHMGDFLNENDDAETGDVFLQCCLFGDAIYG